MTDSVTKSQSRQFGSDDFNMLRLFLLLKRGETLHIRVIIATLDQFDPTLSLCRRTREAKQHLLYLWVVGTWLDKFLYWPERAKKESFCQGLTRTHNSGTSLPRTHPQSHTFQSSHFHVHVYMARRQIRNAVPR